MEKVVKMVAAMMARTILEVEAFYTILTKQGCNSVLMVSMNGT